MEIEDFEFDISEVAAFENVASEDTTNQAVIQLSPQDIITTTTTTSTSSSSTTTTAAVTTQQSASLANAHQLDQHDPLNQDQQLSQDSEQIQPQPTPTKSMQTMMPATASAGKILLVPINTKPGTPGFKHLFQLPPGSSPLTMGALTTTGTNQRPMIQLTPLPASNLHMGKNNYQIPMTTSSQLLPGSSQSQDQQVQHLYFTTTNQAASAIGSPSKNQHQQQQTLNLNNVLNKSLVNNLQNNSSVSSQFNSANLSSLRNQSFNDRALTPNQSVTNEVPKRKPCNCTKSQCLKLYCDCFANGEFCSGCNCTNCFNSLSKEKERQKAISQCLERNPEAFRPKIGKAVKLSEGEPEPDAIERRHTKGCNCKRSGCLKNYCECYESKILCSNLCKCCGCKNYEESFERKSLMQLNSSASENARGILKNLLPTNNNSSTGKEFTKSFITDKVIHASLMCLLQSAQQAEKDGIQASKIPDLIQLEMGKCLRMIVDSATESFNSKKR